MSKILSRIDKELSIPLTGGMLSAWLLAAVAGFGCAAAVTSFERDKDIPSTPNAHTQLTSASILKPFKRPDPTAVSVVHNTPIPDDLMQRVIFAESNGDPTAKAKRSSACGLTQLTRGVIFQYAYEYGEKYGFAETNLIERYTEIKGEKTYLRYRLKNPADDKKIDAACAKADFAIAVGREYLWSVILSLQNSLDRDNIKTFEAYAGFVLGENGSVGLIKAFGRPKAQNHAAKDYVSGPALAANPSLFYHDAENKRHPVSVGELKAVFIKHKNLGNVQLDHIPTRNEYYVLASAQP